MSLAKVTIVKKSLVTVCRYVICSGVAAYYSVSQPPGRGPVPDPGINYTGPREVFLEFVILVF